MIKRRRLVQPRPQSRSPQSPHGSGERGGALVEFAIVLPILLLLFTLIFDAGLGFSSARSTSSAAGSGARVAAGAGQHRHADFLALDAVRSYYDGSGDTVAWVSVYRSVPSADGVVPDGCGPGEDGVAGLCNVYSGAMLASLSSDQFEDDDCDGDPDELWCPTSRVANVGDFLGVAVWATHDPTIGLVSGADYELSERSVFAMYLPVPASTNTP